MQYQSVVYSNASNSNEQHDMEINSARVAANEDVAKNSKDLFEQFDGKCMVSLHSKIGCKKAAKLFYYWHSDVCVH